LKEIRGEHVPETEEYGISSMSFRADRPFHPERYWKFLRDDWMSGIVRSKGLFWLATRMDTGGTWSQAGGQVNISCAGPWMAHHFKPDKDGVINLPPGIPPQIAKILEKPYGDRRQELVFIGVRLDKTKMEEVLMACLLTDEELALGPEVWEEWADPFPQWLAAAPQDAGSEVKELS
jgi:G3E family GTPase